MEMEYSEITFEHAKDMNRMIREIGYEGTKKLVEEVNRLNNFNPEKFDDPKILIKKMKRVVSDFTEDYFYCFVERYEAKENPEFFNVGCFSDTWFTFIKEKISDPLMWFEEKIRCDFHGLPIDKEQFDKYISEQKELYLKDKEILEKVPLSCVYVFRSETGNGNLYKIGKTNDLRSRKRALTKEYKHELFLVNAINCENSQHAFALEKEIHSNWVNKRRYVERINGSASNEWFALDDLELQFLENKYDMVLKGKER